MKGLRILILEDEPADAELELAALAEGGFRCEPTLVSARAAFEAAFEPGRFDLVIADYRLPDYTGLDVIIVRDAKIAALYVFLDSMPS